MVTNDGVDIVLTEGLSAVLEFKWEEARASYELVADAQ